MIMEQQSKYAGESTTVTLSKPVAASDYDRALALLQRAQRVIQAIVDADTEEPLPALQRGVIERLARDLKRELAGE